MVPPPGPLAELEAAVAGLRTARPDLRWAGHEAWHVTLAFLGEVDPVRLAGLAVRLQRAAGRHPVQRLTFRKAGAFPGPTRARVLWIGVDGDLRALGGLAASVAAAARRAGAPPPDEGRRYQPHLTLARSRDPADVGPLIGTLAGFAGSAWTATEIHLIRSHLGPRPWYETVGNWPLRPITGS